MSRLWFSEMLITVVSRQVMNYKGLDHLKKNQFDTSKTATEGSSI